MAEGVCALSGLSYTPPLPQVLKTLSILTIIKDKCSRNAKTRHPPFKEDGTEATAAPDWKGCANVRLRTLESATWFHHYVAAFNINTNQWCMNYVFKRLKFLNNRMVRNDSISMSIEIFPLGESNRHSGLFSRLARVARRLLCHFLQRVHCDLF